VPGRREGQEGALVDDPHGDEFGMIAEAAAEVGRPGRPLPDLARVSVPVGNDQRVSAVRWGSGDPEIVFLHGGGQNARTWDLVALALGRPAVAVDLPGHGRSDWRVDRDYWPWRNAEAVQIVLDALAPRPVALVGMSLGGLTGIRLARLRPDAVRRLVVVDVTPGVSARNAEMDQHQRGTTALIGGPASFATLEEMVDLAVRASPRRPPAAVRRGVVHNSRRLPDGRWAWRYDAIGRPEDGPPDFTPLWEDVAALEVPALLVRGGDSAFVADADEREFLRRHPQARSQTVPGAGHSVQSDRPTELAGIINRFLSGNG
jgi:pimeloyl-ACP methyl ester carboxylesterase